MVPILFRQQPFNNHEGGGVMVLSRFCLMGLFCETLVIFLKKDFGQMTMKIFNLTIIWLKHIYFNTANLAMWFINLSRMLQHIWNEYYNVVTLSMLSFIIYLNEFVPIVYMILLFHMFGHSYTHIYDNWCPMSYSICTNGYILIDW